MRTTHTSATAAPAAALDAWFVNGVVGIGQAPGSVGYRELEIAPAVVGDLTCPRRTTTG